MNKTALSLSFLLGAGGAQATTIDTVDWAAGASGSGAGTGTLQGGTVTVAYQSAAVFNAGLTFANDWNAILATDAVGDANHLAGGVLGTSFALSPQSQTITFSAAVTNPILYVNFGDEGSSLNFGALSLTLLDSNNAQLAGGIATFLGALDSVNDGFAAQINGSFGPGTPLQFTYSTPSGTTPPGSAPSGINSIGFTIGLQVPEPASLFLLAAGAVPLLARRRRRG